MSETITIWWKNTALKPCVRKKKWSLAWDHWFRAWDAQCMCTISVQFCFCTQWLSVQVLINTQKMDSVFCYKQIAFTKKIRLVFRKSIFLFVFHAKIRSKELCQNKKQILDISQMSVSLCFSGILLLNLFILSLSLRYERVLSHTRFLELKK